MENKQENVDQVDNFVTFLSGLQQHEDKTVMFTEKNIVTSLVHILENFDFESSIVSVLDLLQEKSFLKTRKLAMHLLRTGPCVLL